MPRMSQLFNLWQLQQPSGNAQYTNSTLVLGEEIAEL